MTAHRSTFWRRAARLGFVASIKACVTEEQAAQIKAWDRENRAKVDDSSND